MTLYELLNNITQEGYVGITVREPKKRWQEHIYELRGRRHGNPHLQYAFDKYGEDAFEFKIRETFSTLEELNKAEQDVLEKEKSRLYNLAPGGNGHFHSVEIKEKISKNQLKPVVGMCIKTGEIREYASVTDTEKDGFDSKGIGGACRLSIYSGAERGHKRLSQNGWVWMYRKDFSLQELKRRAQQARRGKIRAERPVIGKSLLTGEVVKFVSGEEVKKVLGISAVYKACQGTTNKSLGGYVWVYQDEDNSESLLEKRYKEFKENPPRRGPKTWQFKDV